MTYRETIEYLYNVAPAFEKVGASAYKEGLSNTLALDAHFHQPHRSYQTIHVAGTNGKGSCAHTIAAILQSQGYRVGLYTSPHLVSFRERIRVNGTPISEERVVRFVEEERTFFETLSPSFFELTTALALLYFEEQAVDIAVIEVGLGGRLDCTNIICPILSIITNIGMDHTQFLGTTLEDIAREKAGIIKEGVPCLIGEENSVTRPVFLHVAHERKAPLHFATHYKNPNINFQLKGYYQRQNQDTILSAVSLLRQRLTISDGAVGEGFAHVCQLTGLMGRWQVLRQRPLVVCDAGHNLPAWQILVRQILDTARQHSSLRIVFGMVADKDISAVVDLLPRQAHYYFCQASTHRAIPSNSLLELATQRGLIGENYNSVKEAYLKAIYEAKDGDFVFVGGSSYVVTDLLAKY